MAKSQNGWPVVAKSKCDQGPFGGVTFPNGILAGDVATIARWQMTRYEADVEQMVPGTCWGWYVKNIEGSGTISNHASATAWDINAPQHPMGPPTSSNMTAREIAACHEIEADSDGTLRWGGDFSRPDPMHWEIIGTPARVAAFARKIRNQQEEDDMFAKFGDSGNVVRFLQLRLINLGFPLGVSDAEYGEKTRAALAAAVKAYNGNVNDGRDYGPSEMTCLDVMWARKYGVGADGARGPAGAPGKDGAPGAAGAAGKDGTFTGVLEVTGGRFTAAAVEG